MAKIVTSALLILGLGLFLYTWGLDKVPVHLNQDELEFSLNAYSVSRTLSDSQGNFLPFYFQHLGSFWATPIIVYLTAIFLKFLPLAEWTIRIPSVTVGVTSAFLIFVLSHKIFKNNLLALFAGLAAISTPVLFMNSRLLLDNIYPILFVLVWLILMYFYLETRKPVYLLFSGLALGIGFHSYHAAKVMMPIYFLVSIFYFLILEKERDVRVFASLILGFLVPIIIFIPWLREHPDTLTSQISYVSSIDKSINYREGIFGVISPERLPNFISSYATYLSPGILFVTGDRSLIHSTGGSGAFLFPVIFLLAFGILSALFKKKDNFSKLILFGFLSYPIAPALINEPERISRGLVLVPFVILLTTYGAEFLLSLKDKSFRFLLYAIITLSLLQFVSFISFYFGGYRKISYSWFNYNIGEAFQTALISAKIVNARTIYVDSNIPFADRYLRFYELKLNLSPAQPVYYRDLKRENFANFEKGSLVVVPFYDFPVRSDRVGNFDKIETLREPDGNESFYVFYRDE